MPKANDFFLKNSPPEVKACSRAAPKGREYDEEFSHQPGGIRIDEVALAMQLAALSITDDKEGTLAQIGEANPWHIEALKLLTGSEEEAHKPLSQILDEYYGLVVDAHINESGFRGTYAIDTQGYIAHNDDIIVVSFRCTTTIKDWITNLTLLDSVWEPEEDLSNGHSGYFSFLDGLCGGSEMKPRVHTGFYNNFLAVLPILKEHVDPLLSRNAPPRKLYIVGHSLGAGIAAMAGCYYLLHHDWTASPHRLVNAMAGCPRPCHESMAQVVQDKLSYLRPLDKISMFHITLNEDVVPTVPPAWLGFRHIGKLVYITEDNAVLIGPQINDDKILDENEVKQMGDSYPDVTTLRETTEETQSDYDKLISYIPTAFRDHMPDFYLRPLIDLFERIHGVITPKEESEVLEENVEQDEMSYKSIHVNKRRFRKKIDMLTGCVPRRGRAMDNVMISPQLA